MNTLYGFDLISGPSTLPFRVTHSFDNSYIEWVLYPGPGQFHQTLATGASASAMSEWTIFNDAAGSEWVRIKCFPLTTLQGIAIGTEIPAEFKANAFNLTVRGVAKYLGMRQMANTSRTLAMNSSVWI